MSEKFSEDIADDLYKACKLNVKVVLKKLSESVRWIRLPMYTPKIIAILDKFDYIFTTFGGFRI